MANLYRPLPRRWLDAAKWETVITGFWQERCTGTPYEPENGRFYNVHFARMVQTLGDLRRALEILTTVKERIPQEFLDTRPPYMSREGPQWEPDRYAWMALLEPVLEENNGIKLATRAELEAVIESFRTQLLEFYNRKDWILDRAAYEAGRTMRQKRTYFMDVFRDWVIYGAMQPQRVERMLNIGGFEALENVFCMGY